MTWDEEVAAHRRALDTSFAVFCRTPHEALLWLTTVIAAYVVTINDDIRDVIRAAVDRYDAECAAAYQMSGRTYRSSRGWTRFCGVIEIDLIHPKIARACSRMKAGLLAELGINVEALQHNERIIVLHEHAIIDHRGHASAEAFKRDLRRAWPGDRRIHGKRLYTEGTVAQNLRNLAEYSGKFRFGYSVAWDEQKTRYLRSGKFEPEWIEYVKNLYRTVGVSRLLNANITIQGCKAGMHTDRPVFRGETAEGEPFQLVAAHGLSLSAEDDDMKPSTPDNHHERSSQDDGGRMRASEIADYLKPERISAEALNDIENALTRQGVGLMRDQLPLMYGDPERDLRIEQQRLDAAKTRAEIGKLEAAAALDRAEARPTKSPSSCRTRHKGHSPVTASEARPIRSRSPAWPCAVPGRRGSPRAEAPNPTT